MTAKKTTEGPTESDLEAKIHQALRYVFPWLPDGSIQHQTTFSLAFGDKDITVDGSKRDTARARTDILLHRDQQPLAVLELKRPGMALGPDDEKQGLSYARVLHPRPPLVVITNGTDVRLLETHTGEQWVPDEFSQESFAKLLTAASRAATSDLKSAISTLMGLNPEIWVQAIRQTSEQNLMDSSGDWPDVLQPFVPTFLIPRQATQDVIQKLRDRKRLILVEGPPLIGKSNVLRELTKQTENADDFAVLFIEADTGTGILQKLADTLSQALDWPANKDEVRAWLRHLSHSDGPALVFAVDGGGLDRDALREDIADLSSSIFGQSLRIVVALDDTVADRLVVTSSGRKLSAIGRRAVRVPLDRLDDGEFAAAMHILQDHRVSMMNGAEVSPDLRLPWVLRSVMSAITSQPQYADKNLGTFVPPLLGLELIAHTRTRFCDDDELRRLFSGMAQAVIGDSQDRKRPISLILESVAIYVARRQTLLRYLPPPEIEDLVEQGYIRPVMHDSSEPILVVRLPELLASEAANLLAVELAQRARDDPDEAAQWLSDAARDLPLGDIVAAQAVLDASIRHGGLPFNLIAALIDTPPREEVIQPGTRAAMRVPGLGVMDMTFREQGTLEVGPAGQNHLSKLDLGEEDQVIYDSLYSWLVLSRLGGCPFVMENEDHQPVRFDPTILLEVGTCRIPLRRPDPNPNGILTHDIPSHGTVVCHKAGIVEPITQAIFHFLGSEGEKAEQWIAEAVKRNSFPLLARTNIALRQLSYSADPNESQFARRMLDDVIHPAMSAFLTPH